MCDVLPETHASIPQEVDEALKRAITQCRETFRHLPDSPSKLSVVSALEELVKPACEIRSITELKKRLVWPKEISPELKLPCNRTVLDQPLKN